MGDVVDLGTWRERRRQERGPDDAGLGDQERVRVRPDAFRKLEQAVRRLDPVVERVAAPDGTVDPRVQTELLAITGAVSRGRTDEARERAERLADRLEHPTSRRPPGGSPGG